MKNVRWVISTLSFVYNNKTLTKENQFHRKNEEFKIFVKKFVKMTADFGEIRTLSKSIDILAICEAI